MKKIIIPNVRLITYKLLSNRVSPRQMYLRKFPGARHPMRIITGKYNIKPHNIIIIHISRKHRSRIPRK